MILPITLTIAGAAALLNIWLAIRVGQARASQKVFVGDGGNEVVVGRMRAQANFVEYTPFVLILIGLIELARGTTLFLWIAGVVYILGRIVHAFGMDVQRSRNAQMRLRMVGISLTMLTLLALAVFALAIPYFTTGTITSELVPAG